MFQSKASERIAANLSNIHPKCKYFIKQFFARRSIICGRWGVCVQEEVYANKIREIDVVIVVALMWQRRTMHDADVSV